MEKGNACMVSARKVFFYQVLSRRFGMVQAFFRRDASQCRAGKAYDQLEL